MLFRVSDNTARMFLLNFLRLRNLVIRQLQHQQQLGDAIFVLAPVSQTDRPSIDWS
jgi:hypothetical protein